MPTLSGPVPDLAGGQPKISDGGRNATITLRTVRWDVPSGRRVTATDELRALKRLCLPQISSPVRGYLEESVVGYAAACRQLALDPPKTLGELDAVTISGLTTQGDTTLQIQLHPPDQRPDGHPVAAGDLAAAGRVVRRASRSPTTR